MIEGSLRIQHLHEAFAYQKTPHFHDMNEIIFTMNDDSLMLINQGEFPIRMGTLTFIAAGSLHAKINPENRMINSYVIHYPPSLLTELSTLSTNLHSIFADMNSCLQLEGEDIGKVLAIYERLELDPKAEGGDLNNLMCFLDILLTAARCMKTYGLVEPTHFSREDKWLAPILDYIDHHLTEPLTLKELSEHFFISEGTLCHSFKRKTGSTVVSYINMQRIRYACILLRQGASVQETCKRSGFKSVEHFIRTFTTYADTTPGKYAKAVQKGQNIPIPLAVYRFGGDSEP